MDDALDVICDMNENIWLRVTRALEDLSEEEIQWRPLPQANNINLIVRHLRIEAEWHLHSLERGAPMPTIAVPASQEAIDAISFDFQNNLKELEKLYRRFLEILRQVSLSALQQRTADAYGEWSKRKGNLYLLGYHQATHVATHCGQIQMIRNLFRKTRGEPARFFPDNPTYPK